MSGNVDGGRAHVPAKDFVSPPDYCAGEKCEKPMQTSGRLSFEEIFDHHFQDVYAYVAWRVAPDEEAARDLTQEVFLAALNGLSRLRGEASPLTWLRSIARNKVADHFRDNARGGPESIDEAEDVASMVSPDVSDSQLRALVISRVMKRLASHYSELLEDKYIEGLSVREMARRRELSEKAVESALSRARAAFREIYKTATAGKECEA